MKFKFSPFKGWTKFEFILWVISVSVVTAAFAFGTEKDFLNLTASLIGCTFMIYNARGEALGQVLTVIFSLMYGIISYRQSYYGEMITYLGMSMPIAAISVFTWIKNSVTSSETGSKVTKVRKLSFYGWIVTSILAAVVTVIFYFILKALGTANLIFSTLSVTTSFFAAFLTMLRNPYYGVGYACNDAVLIVLWVLASIEDPRQITMVFCFIVFLFNDLYGFVSWKRREKLQAEILRIDSLDN